MAKKSAPKKSKIPESLIKVTPINRKFCIVKGRECLVATVGGLEIDKQSSFMIRPRLKAEGWFEWDDDKCFVSTIESVEEYTEKFDDVITLLIKKGRLYIDPTRKLINFNYNEKKK